MPNDLTVIRAKATDPRATVAPVGTTTVLSLCDEVQSLRAEIERLQIIIDNLHAVEEKHRETANAEFHRAVRLQAENQRLRRALKEIRVASTEEFWECGSIARAALTQETDHDHT